MVRDSKLAEVKKIVRKIYQRRPYPSADRKQFSRNRHWGFFPPAWINALWKPGRERFACKKVLIAGCGTGAEAFRMRWLQPDAEILAVDFSPRSIAIGRKLQREI